MRTRMTWATAVAAVALTVLAGCGSDDSDGGSTGGSRPSPTATTPSDVTATPSVDPSTEGAIALRGEWHDPEADWIVHFHEDGTYTEDFQGMTDFRVGKYAVDGATVSLIGDDGNTDKGTVEGDSLVFKLGTLTRM
jgi:hypothetical protein